MSFPHIVKIACEECKKESEFTIWDSINVTLNPELRDKVIDCSLFEWTCPHCGYSSRVGYRFLYHDMEHNAMVWMDSGWSYSYILTVVNAIENDLKLQPLFNLMNAHQPENEMEFLLFDSVCVDPRTGVNSLKFLVAMSTDSPYYDLTGREYYIPYSKFEKEVANSSN